jgi:hypothetical protein
MLELRAVGVSSMAERRTFRQTLVAAHTIFAEVILRFLLK